MYSVMMISKMMKYAEINILNATAKYLDIPTEYIK